MSNKKNSQDEWEWYQWYTARLSESVNKLTHKEQLEKPTVQAEGIKKDA